MSEQNRKPKLVQDFHAEDALKDKAWDEGRADLAKKVLAEIRGCLKSEPTVSDYRDPERDRYAVWQTAISQAVSKVEQLLAREGVVIGEVEDDDK